MKNGEAKKNQEIMLLKTRLKKLEARKVQYGKTEAFLKNSQERLKILFEFAPDAYYINDLKGKFIDGNRAAEKILGYKREELIGKSFLSLNLLPVKSLAKATKALAKNAVGKETGPDTYVLNRKNGSQVSVEIRTFPVKIDDKKVILGIARDISHRKWLEDELRKMNNELEKRVAEKTVELQERVIELERFYDATVDREIKMKELRDRVEELESQLEGKNE